MPGDFNGWDPHACPLVKRANGTRSASLALPAGAAYAFKYLGTDGEGRTDPAADGTSTNEYGEVDSVVET